MVSCKRFMQIDVERLGLSKPFRISGHTFVETPVVVVTVSEGKRSGRGEAAGVYYLGDDLIHITGELEDLRSVVENGLSRQELQDALPAGGARNALDCALWDLEAKLSGRPVWSLAGLNSVRPLTTTFTLGANTPLEMQNAAAGYTVAKALKLKLSGDVAMDVDRVKGVRAARPDCWIGVDANQGFTVDELAEILPTLIQADVALIEQPLRRGEEGALRSFSSPIPLVADESVQTSLDLPEIVGLFQMINIKLDKSGGLTEALAMAERARKLKLGVMVGNMTGTSLAMAPGFVLGQQCQVVDLDGPTFLAQDRTPSVSYSAGTIWCPDAVWGAGHAARSD